MGCGCGKKPKTQQEAQAEVNLVEQARANAVSIAANPATTMAQKVVRSHNRVRAIHCVNDTECPAGYRCFNNKCVSMPGNAHII